MLKYLPYTFKRKNLLVLTLIVNLALFLRQVTNRYLLLANSFKLNFFKSKIVALPISVLVFLLAIVPGKSFAAVTVTAPSLSVYACGGSFPTAYTTLGNIVIDENGGNKSDFVTGAGQTLVLAAPSNFEFNGGAGFVSFIGGNAGAASITVTATTITITYTVSGTNSFDVMTISGIQVRGITAATTQPVTRTGGTGTITGDAVGKVHATLTSVPQTVPSITSAATGVICSNTGQSYTITSSTGSTTYNWNRAAVGGISNGAVTNQTSNPITESLVNTTNAPIDVTYVITPTANTCSGSPFNYVVTVNPKPSVTNQTATICSGGTFTVTPTNGGGNIVPTGTTYTLTNPVSSPVGAVTGGSAQATGQSSISQTLTNTTNASATLTYTVTPTSGSCTGNTFTITVTVSPKPSITNQTATICSGGSFAITPTNSGGNIVPTATTYTWTNSVSSPVGAVTGGSAQATGQSLISQTLSNTTTASATLIYIVTPTAGSCTGNTFTVTVTVNPKATVINQTATICSGTAFTVSPVDGIGGNIIPTGTTYTWTNPISSPAGAVTGGSAQATGQSSISQTLTNTTNVSATLTYTVTPKTGSCAGNTFTITVIVSPKPSITNRTATICSGGTFTITLTNGGGNIVPTGTTYTWTNPISSPVGAVTGGSAQATGQSSISQTLANTTTASAILTYTVTPASESCAGNTFTVTVTVNPKATVTNQTPIICSGTAFTVTPVDGVGGNIIPAGTTYSWTNPVSSPVGAITGGSAQATGQSSISQTLTNTTDASATLTYNVTPTSGSCAGNTFTVTVTIDPKPSIINQTVTICSGGSFTTTPTNGGGNIVPTNITYAWSAPVTTGGLTGGAGGSGTSITGILSNPTITAQTATYTVTPSSGSCTGSAFTVTITVYAPPVITTQPDASQTVCNTYPATFTVAATGDGLTYQWYKGATPLTDNAFITGSNTNQLTIDPTAPSDAGMYNVVVSSTAPCSAATSADATLNIDQVIAMTTQPVVSQTLCEGNTFTLTVASTGSNLTYQWRNGTTDLVDGGNISGANTATLTLSNITTADASTQYNVVIIDAAVDLGDCNTAFSNKATLIVNKKSLDPTSATAASPVICNGGSTTLSLNGGGGTGEVITWYSGSCGGTLVGTGNSLPVSPTTTTTYYVRYEDGAPCNYFSACASVTVTVNQKSADPTSATASSPTICNGQSTTLTLNGGGGGTGEVIKWYSTSCGVGLVGTGNDLSISPTATTTYYGRYEDGAPCNYNSLCASVTITVNQKPANPTSATASSSTICTGSSVTLNLVGGGGGTGQVVTWYSGSCGGTLVGTGNGLSVAPAITSTYFGRYETSSPCNFNSNCASVTVNVSQQPTTSVAGSNQTICSTTSNVTLNANTPIVGTGAWTIAAGSKSTLLSQFSNTSNPAATFTPAGGAGTYTLIWTISNSPCTASSSSVVITVVAAATANAGTDQTANCATSTTLSATAPVSGTGIWSVVSGPAGYTFGNVNSPTSSFTNTTLTSTGTYVLRWTINNNPCATTFDDVNITLIPPIKNNNIYFAAICRDQTTGVVTPIINPVPPGVSGGNGTYTYAWKRSCNGHSNFVTLPGETSSSLVLQPNTNCFYRRIVTSGSCVDSSEVHLNINNVPTSFLSVTPTTGTASYCAGGSGITVGTNGSIQGSVDYTATYELFLNGVSTGITRTGTGGPLDFGPQTAVGTYTVKETVSLASGANACGSTIIPNNLTITIDQAPTTSAAGSNQHICGTTATLAGNTPIIGKGLWTLVSGAGTITTPASPTSGITGLGTGNNVFKWTISNGTCPSSSSQVAVAGYQSNIIPLSLNATSPTVCDGTATTLTQTGGSLGTGTAAWKWYSDPSYTTLIDTGNGATANIIVTPGVNTTYYLRAEITSFTPCPAITPAGSVTINVNKRPTSNISGTQTLCNGTATLTLAVRGSGAISGTLSDGTAFSGTAPTITVNVNPSTTTIYTVSTLSDATCTSIAGDRTGSPTVTVLTGTAGVWTGAANTDWFNCLNWANGFVPTSAVNVTIPGTINSPQINSPGAQAKDVTINGSTLTFGVSGALQVYGNWVDNVASPNGFTGNIGTVIFSGSANQIISTTKGTESFYNLEINKTASNSLVILNNNITVTNNLILTKGIFVTGYSSFTFNNTGTLAQPANYTDSYIATSDASGTPLNVAGPTTPFTGDVGFRINNVGNTDTYFPVGASYLSAETGQPPSPNRMMINNAGQVQDFTVVVTYGDIGYTHGSRGALRVNRIWYVNASSGTSKATMKLFFTKRDMIGWGTNENEVEQGFNYGQVALVQKDYSGGRGSFINLSNGQDIRNLIGDSDNTEVYAQYTFSSGPNLTNGIHQFNRFSIVNPGDIILPVTMTSFKAYQKGNGVQIDWTALNEINVDHYDVEKSANGTRFTTIGRVNAFKNRTIANYSKTDPSPQIGNNFYRVRAVDKDGALTYTSIALVNVGNDKMYVTIYPNPVQNRLFNLQFTNLPGGDYDLILYNALGQPVLSRKIEHPGGSAIQSFTLPANVGNGIYILKLFSNTYDFKGRLVVE